MAIEGAEYLNSRNPHAEIMVRDLDGADPSIVIKAQIPRVRP
jgi:hypothetical protein